MNNVNLKEIALQKQKLREKYGLDEKSLQEFKEKLKKVDKEESQKLGKELFELISKRGYKEETELDKAIELIYKGADIEYKNEKKGDYVLLICSRKNYLKTFITLLKAGANVNQANNYLTTSLMAASRHGCKEILELLILFDADINAVCKDGDNAIVSAKRHNQLECFNILVNANCYLNSRNYANETLLNIKSEEDFNLLKISYSLNKYEEKNVTAEDVKDLLEEAKKRVRTINS